MVSERDIDLLNSHPPVPLGDAELFVDRLRPVAALVSPRLAPSYITWPDAPLPSTSGPSEVFGAPNFAWVVYRELESFESAGTHSSTAVRIGRDGRWSSVELGHLIPIGADDDGVWLTDQPVPMIENISEDDNPALEEDELFHRARDAPLEEWEDLPASIPHVFSTDFDPLHDSESYKSAPFGSRGIDLGSPVSDDISDVLPSILTPAITGPVQLVRHGPSVDDVMDVDRIVSNVEMVDGRLRLTYHPTGPIVTVDPGGDSASYEYPQETIDVDVSAGLPEEIRVSDYPSTKIPMRSWDSWDWDNDDLDTATPTFSLAGVEGAQWALKKLDDETMSASIEAVRVQLVGLAEPDLVWLDVDDKVHRVRSDYRDLSVRVENAWPLTEVIAEFTYRRFVDRRFRYRVPVFDAAGRPIPYPYLTVYLMEDLDTLDLEEVNVSIDGFTELSAHSD
ncbi:MAG: hypothetical protein H7288_24505 [Kineosporiaceae bacterium]|nr:hypothetical protein [Aeromicrobium sp.]